jgi:predicted ATPase/class 3 adenylate cyclase
VIEPPTGEVTFLFTDIEGSTMLWDQWPDIMEAALAEHDQRVRIVVDDWAGYVFTTAGDSFSIAFGSPTDAVSAAIGIQLAMREPALGLDLRIRMGLHTGSASLRDGDYFGGALNRCARLTSAAHGGQILLSGSTTELVASELPDGVELVDMGVHRLRDLAEPEHIHQLNHPELRSSFPKLRSLEGPGDTLPNQLTSFVGRQQEIADVAALLDEHRLVTLSGAGGAGKTRLALEVAEHLVSAFPDGLRFAELAALLDKDVFESEVAERFGATPVVDVPLVTTIAEVIGKRRMLVILDNCEQIIEHVAALSRDLLTVCPNLHIIATSRERLAIVGEVVYRVPSLSVPPAGVDAATSLEFDAIRLFVDRALLVDPAFELGSTNVDDVVAICRRLDGIPLAIELAAARVRSMSAAQISARLDERFRILTASERSGSHRQQTLLRTIEWSHDLLDERERTVFRRLGAFASDFSLEAAEQVAAGGPIDEFDVLELVTGLVDKSMVATEAGADGATRYQLLESIREFALRQLDEASERDATSHRHARYYADLAETLQAMHRRGELAAALVGLDAAEDNFRLALRFALDTSEWELAARLVSGLGYLWYAAGTHREGVQWCRELFDADPDLPDLIRAGALHSYATLLGVTGRPDLGVEVNREQVALRRRLGDPLRLGSALNNLGDLMADTGDRAGAEPVLLEAIEVYRSGGGNASLMVTTLANTFFTLGDYDNAEPRFREAIQEARQGDDAYGIAVAMGGLASLLAVCGRPTEARPVVVEARERYEELNVAPGVTDVDMYMAIVERDVGSFDEAARRLHMALNAPGGTWYDQADYWIAQLTASVIDDKSDAALLVAAAAARYERIAVPQPRWVIEDLERTTQQLQRLMDADEFGRCERAGGRRTRTEVVQATNDALESFIGRFDEPTDGEPTTALDPRVVERTNG